MSPSDIQVEIQYLQPKLQDLFHDQTGIDIDDLNWNTEKLDLDNDEQYVKILKEYHETVEQL